ncbi:MAG: glycosyltransferase family 2 protein [Vulcanimicrobiaceae bacterium]
MRAFSLPRPLISVVMPAYNESTSIFGNVLETVRTLESFEYNFEVLVVDDGSADKTHLAALRAKAKCPDRIRVVRYDGNEGKGNALSAGVHHSRGEYVVFLDADMDLHPEQLPTFFAIMVANDVDAVIGSKMHPASNVDYPIFRRILSTGYYVLIRTLFGLPTRDTQTGIKVFRRSAVAKALPFTYSKGFAFDIELLAIMNMLGARFADAPITLSFRRPAGRIDLGIVVSMFFDTLAIFLRLQRDRKLIKYIEKNGRIASAGKEQGIALLGQLMDGQVKEGFRDPVSPLGSLIRLQAG